MHTAARQQLPQIQRSNTLFGGLQQRLSNLGIQRTQAHDSVADSRDASGLRALHDPRDVFVELIFVHGLRGDYRETWTYNNDAATFWPLWLPEDAEGYFSHVRIHSFGYNADQPNRRILISKLNDFGILLCESLFLNNYLKRDAQVRRTAFVLYDDGLRLSTESNHIRRSFAWWSRGQSCLCDYSLRTINIAYLRTGYQPCKAAP